MFTDYICIPYFYFGGDGIYNGPIHYTADDGDPWYGWRVGLAWPRRSEGLRPTPRFRLSRSRSSEIPISWDISWDATDAIPPHNDYRSRRSNHVSRDGFTASGENMLYVDLHGSWHKLDHGYGPDEFARSHYR